MPTYDYQCRSCGFITEVVHSMFEDGPTECERCGGQLRRVFHPTGIIFKGGGFYKTDSRSAPSTSVAGTGGGGSAGSGDASSQGAPATDKGTGDKTSTTKSSGDDAGKSGSGSG